jgi:hypothetical protein
METLIASLIQALATQGSAYTLLAISLLGNFYLLAKWSSSEQKCFDISQTLQEKRVNERTETIAVLNAGADANKKLADSISVRTETLNNLINVVTSGNTRMDAILSDILRRLGGGRVSEN